MPGADDQLLGLLSLHRAELPVRLGPKLPHWQCRDHKIGSPNLLECRAHSEAFETCGQGLGPQPFRPSLTKRENYRDLEEAMTRRRIIFGAFVVFAMTTTTASASIITLMPVSQATLSRDGLGETFIFPPESFGLFVGTLNGRLQSGIPSLTNEGEAIAEYDFSGLLSASINSATLGFVVRNPVDFGATGGCFDLGGCPPIAGVNLASFAGNGTVNLGDFDAGTSFATISPQPAYNVPTTIDVTSAIRDLVTSDSGFPSFRISALPGLDGAIGIDDLSLRVDVTPVAAIPEPATALLFGPLLAGLVCARWCRRPL